MNLAEQKDWIELEKFSKSKKSPIGYEVKLQHVNVENINYNNVFLLQPFVDVCLEHRNEMEAQKYVAKVADDVKVKYYIKLEYVTVILVKRLFIYIDKFSL
jgi:hypothetical protein